MALFPEPSELQVWPSGASCNEHCIWRPFPLAFHQAAASSVQKMNTARAQNHGAEMSLHICRARTVRRAHQSPLFKKKKSSSVAAVVVLLVNRTAGDAFRRRRQPQHEPEKGSAKSSRAIIYHKIPITGIENLELHSFFLLPPCSVFT